LNLCIKKENETKIFIDVPKKYFGKHKFEWSIIVQLDIGYGVNI